MATPGRKIGYDCEYVKQPPENLQSECPVCLQILREPHQAPCCGNSFCHACINRIKTDKKPCPTCKEDNLVTFFDKRLQRSLHECQVYCSNKEEGCDWKGELGQLDNHLNLSPQPDKLLEGCKYSEIECIYCSESIKRCDITIHQGDHCDKRPFSCDYCHSYKSHYGDVIHNHWPVCGYHPVHCPNECGKLPQRQALENHIARDCPKADIDCDFRHVGCDVRLPRKYMPAHLNENLVTHMSLQAASHSKLQASHEDLKTSHNTLIASHNTLLASHDKLRANHKHLKISHNKLEGSHKNLQTSYAALQGEVGRLQDENKTLKEKAIATLEQDVTKLKKTQHQLVIKTTPVPHELVMENFEQHHQHRDQWYSPPFYTHPGGYRFCLSVYGNGCGDGKGKHVSVFVYLMRGEFDDHLKFPFRGDIAVQLVNQEGGEEHITETVPFTDETPDDTAGRVTEGERQVKGWGHYLFVRHGQLKPKYLRYGCLRFRVLKVELK